MERKEHVTDTEADEIEPGKSGSRESGSRTAREASPSSKTSESSKTAEKKPRRRGGLGRFLREVIAELRKVVYPTRKELLTYTAVVLVFVVAIMIFVSALDFGIAKLIGWAFGG